MKQYCVYILTNKNNSVLYIGVTGNLPRRISEHKNKLVKGFTQKYNCNKWSKLKIIGLILVSLAFIASSYYFISIYSRHKIVNLSGIEIKEYNGEKLGSINDFRENSIKGAQYINKQTYRLEVSGLVDKGAIYSYEDLLKKTAENIYALKEVIKMLLISKLN
jgi:hypothetical protein